MYFSSFMDPQNSGITICPQPGSSTKSEPKTNTMLPIDKVRSELNSSHITNSKKKRQERKKKKKKRMNDQTIQQEQ